MDFDDLLMQTVFLFQRYPEVAEKYQGRLEHVLVDEFQDTNFAQYKLVQALAAPQHNVFAVGDADQSIYAFRGADYRNVLRFERDYADHTTVLLEQNYRSTQTILDAAMAIIDRNPNRTPKRLFTDRGAGEKIALFEAYDEDEEARFIVDQIVRFNEEAEYNPGECAVMYRTNAQSRALEGAFKRAGVPYRLIGATAFYQRAEIKDLLAYLRVIVNPSDAIGLERVINTPPRGIGNKTLETLADWAGQLGLTLGAALLSLLAGAEGPFSPRARKSLEQFAALLAGWQTLVAEGKSPLEVLDAVAGRHRLRQLPEHRRPRRRRPLGERRGAARGGGGIQRPGFDHLPDRGRPGLGRGRARRRGRGPVPDDPAQRQGPGIPRGLHLRDRGGHAAPHAQRGSRHLRRRRGPAGGTALCCTWA